MQKHSTATDMMLAMLQAERAFDAYKQYKHLVVIGVLAFDDELKRLNLRADVRLATISHCLQELSFAAVAGIACCEDDYKARFERHAETIRARALTLANDTATYQKIAASLGVPSSKNCNPGAEEKPTVN